MNAFKICLLIIIFISHFSPLGAASLYDEKSGSFNYFEAYSIPKLHEAKLKGQGYKVSILENNADIDHLAFRNKKLTNVILPIGKAKSEEQSTHGNHVSALIVGETLFIDSANDYVNTIIALYKDFAERQKLSKLKVQIFNTNVENFTSRLAELQRLNMNEVRSELRGLISNTNKVLGIKEWSTAALLESYDDALSARFLGGVAKEADGYLYSTGSFEGKYSLGDNYDEQTYNDYLKDWLERFDKAAENSHIINLSSAFFNNRHYAPIGLKADIIDNILQILQKHDAVLVITASNDFFTIGDNSNSAKQHKHLVDLISNPDLAARVLIVGNLAYHDENALRKKEEVANAGLAKLIPRINDFAKTEDENTKQKDGEKLYDYVKNNLQDIEESALSDALQKMQSTFKYGWDNKNDLNEKILELKSSFEDDIYQSPTEKKKSGLPVSTRAGVAKDHFIMTYGKDIRSAWYRFSDFSNQTGSSMAAPITTGILILLHQYMNNQKPTSWTEIIKMAKEKARPIGKPEVYGRGMLDTSMLFPDLIK